MGKWDRLFTVIRDSIEATSYRNSKVQPSEDLNELLSGIDAVIQHETDGTGRISARLKVRVFVAIWEEMDMHLLPYTDLDRAAAEGRYNNMKYHPGDQSIQDFFKEYSLAHRAVCLHRGTDWQDPQERLNHITERLNLRPEVHKYMRMHFAMKEERITVPSLMRMA